MKKTFCILLSIFSLLSCKRDLIINNDVSHEFLQVSANPQYTSCDILCKNESVQYNDWVSARLLLSEKNDMEEVETFPMEKSDSCLSCHITDLVEGRQYYYTFEAYTEYDKFRSKDIFQFTTKLHPSITVTTNQVYDVAKTNAKGSGTIAAASGVMVTERGMCWSTSHNPTVQDPHLSNGYGTGEFLVSILDLVPGTQYYARAYARNSETGIEYGDEVIFATNSVEFPEVVTLEISGVTSTSAVIHGQVVSEGISPLVERGICWGLESGPVVSGNHSSAGSELGSFSVTMSNLTPNSTYFLRAYAINAHGTAYGAEMRFTALEGQAEVQTLPVTDIKAVAAIGHGKVLSQGASPITDRGLCWSTYHYPSITDEHVSVGSGTGEFDAFLNGLDVNSTYYIRAYASNEFGTNYGEELCFTTLMLPIVTTASVTDITTNSAICSGNVSDEGDTSVTERGVCWSSEHNPTIINAHVANGSGEGDFSCDMTGLVAGKKYYARAYATSSLGTSYGTELMFSTALSVPVVMTSEAFDITTNTAKCGGEVISNGGSSIIERGICWFTSSNPTIDKNHQAIGGELGSFAISMTNLMGGTTYFVRAYAINSEGTSYGNEVSFSVPSIPPPTGAIDGFFTINEKGGRVYFSKGNLQFRASTNTWQFSTNQWDIVGYDNSNISSNYDGWIDLFGWGTSGYYHGAVCYQPWSTSTNSDDYYAYGNPQYNLYDQSGQADWGCNAISNGGNQIGLWRTLTGGTNGEWDYVLNVRPTAYGIRYAKAMVNGVVGIVLVPDNWNATTYSLNNCNQPYADYNDNNISSAEWTNALESAGCVFLPSAGCRYGTTLSNFASSGYYWSSSYYDDGWSHCMSIADPSIAFSSQRSAGLSVRLVRPVN